MHRVIFFLVMFAAVTIVAQEPPVVSETDTAQTQEAGQEQEQVWEDVAEGIPETFDPTEQVSEDYPVEFPVDI